jgi:hypothetical protein
MKLETRESASNYSLNNVERELKMSSNPIAAVNSANAAAKTSATQFAKKPPAVKSDSAEATTKPATDTVSISDAGKAALQGTTEAISSVNAKK